MTTDQKAGLVILAAGLAYFIAAGAWFLWVLHLDRKDSALARDKFGPMVGSPLDDDVELVKALGRAQLRDAWRP